MGAINTEVQNQAIPEVYTVNKMSVFWIHVWVKKFDLLHDLGAIDNQLNGCETNDHFQISLGFQMQTENLTAMQSICHDKAVIICSGRQG